MQILELLRAFRNFHPFLNVSRNVIRMVGSTACAITNVACGRGDGYFGAGFHIWDIAAAGLILKEAGGFTFNMKGETKNVKDNLIKNSGKIPSYFR